MKFNAWSFLRNVISMGCAIEIDTQKTGRCYEEHVISLDGAARKYAAELEKQMGWQPIETAPKDDKAVVVASTLNGKVTTVRMCVWNGLGWYEVYSGAGINYVTHWMPLPPVNTAKPAQASDET